MSSNQQRETGSARGGMPALVLGCVPAFMASLDVLVVTVALATIRHDLHASVQQLAWMVNADVLTFAMLMPLAAALGDRLGRRRMFSVGLAVFTAASAACALAPSAGALIAARAVQGAGGALLTPLSLALVAAAFPAGQRGKAMGVWSAVTGLAVALGPLVGGVIIEGVSWPWIFWVNVPIGVAAIVVTPRVFHESRGPRRTLDLLGVALASGGLLALVWGIVRGNGGGWTSAATVTAIGAGAGLLVAFVTWQLHGPSPMLPRHLLTSRASLAANGASFMLTASLFGAAFLVPCTCRARCTAPCWSPGCACCPGRP
jgi:EmrB/QacA subfamily drug resistance transporter